MVKHNKDIEVVVFHDPEKRKQTSHHNRSKREQKDPLQKPAEVSKKIEFDQKKAKYEIRKLGIFGMDKKNKETAMTDFLVELGAKPPKNWRYHIQEYQKMQKEKKEARLEEEDMERKAGIKKRKAKIKRKQDKDDLLHYIDGQAGFYKNGVQFVKGQKK